MQLAARCCWPILCTNCGWPISLQAWGRRHGSGCYPCRAWSRRAPSYDRKSECLPNHPHPHTQDTGVSCCQSRRRQKRILKEKNIRPVPEIDEDKNYQGSAPECYAKISCSLFRRGHKLASISTGVRVLCSNVLWSLTARTTIIEHQHRSATSYSQLRQGQQLSSTRTGVLC